MFTLQKKILFNEKCKMWIWQNIPLVCNEAVPPDKVESSALEINVKKKCEASETHNQIRFGAVPLALTTHAQFNKNNGFLVEI